MPDSEEDKSRRQQQSQHVTKGRECERHFFSGSARRFLARSADDAGSFATVSRFASVSSSTRSGKLASILIVALLPSSGVMSFSVVSKLVFVFAALVLGLAIFRCDIKMQKD